jgi:hypothetical protein
MPQININTDAFVVLANKLERLNRSALPVAVRQTLNDAAFDVKQKTLQESASKNFIRRSPNFFKAFSAVNKADGFNINQMKAEVGMTDRGKVSARTAVKHMDLQEEGGATAEGAAYLRAARAGNNAGKVRRSNYFDKSKLVHGALKRPGSAKSNFVAMAFIAAKEKKNISIKTSRGRFLVSVSNVRKLKNGAIKITSKLLMKDRAGKPAHITATHFSREAAQMTVNKIPGFWLKQAEKQFERALK